MHRTTVFGEKDVGERQLLTGVYPLCFDAVTACPYVLIPFLRWKCVTTSVNTLMDRPMSLPDGPARVGADCSLGVSRPRMQTVPKPIQLVRNIKKSIERKNHLTLD